MTNLNTRQLNFIEAVQDPDGRLHSFLHAMHAAVKRTGKYALCIGSTATSDLEGISAAGADGMARRMTPAIDAEALVLGQPLSSESVPVSPRGIVSPVVLSRAMLKLIDCVVEVFNCGAYHAPQVQHHCVGQQPAACPDTGCAMTLDDVRALHEEGRKIGRRLAEDTSYVVVGECVPGGTTTALAVLTAFGIQADKLVSSSMPTADYDRRSALVAQGIAKSRLTPDMVRADALQAVAAVGDPMQPFAAGLVLEASKHVPVVLGGGTQMLAVYAIASAIAGDDYFRERAVAVITTKWVAFDRGSNPGQLAKLLRAPLAASCPDFHSSRHDGLRAYEEGNVKEGVAAGAMMALAHLSGFSEVEIRRAIDDQYDEMVNARAR